MLWRCSSILIWGMRTVMRTSLVISTLLVTAFAAWQLHLENSDATGAPTNWNQALPATGFSATTTLARVQPGLGAAIDQSIDQADDQTMWQAMQQAMQPDAFDPLQQQESDTLQALLMEEINSNY